MEQGFPGIYRAPEPLRCGLRIEKWEEGGATVRFSAPVCGLAGLFPVSKVPEQYPISCNLPHRAGRHLATTPVARVRHLGVPAFCSSHEKAAFGGSRHGENEQIRVRGRSSE